MKSFINWLSTPYFFNPSAKFKLKTSLAFGFFVFIFLFLFKPFTLSTFKGFLFEYTISIGIITFLGSLFVLFIPSFIFKSYFNEDNWTVGRNLLLILFGMLFIGSVLWYNAEVFKKDKDLENLSLPVFLSYTFLVGAIPAIFIIFINEKDVRQKRERKAQEINTQKKKKLEDTYINLEQKTTIYSDNEKEFLSFKIDKLIYITSQGNYASFFLKDDKNQIKEKILRVTLQKINLNLEGYSKIIRCHKSYIVNSEYVTGIKGNARGYLLEFDEISFDIPVSRSFSKKSLMQFLLS